MHHSKKLGRITVPLYGHHNVLNALAAIAVVLGEGIDFDQITAAAIGFRSAFRRFQILSAPEAAITIVDDYAHHSTEVRVTLEAARLHFAGRRILAVFRPHTYSRIEALLPEYQQAFADADRVYITEIEAARETGKTHTVSAGDIIKHLKQPAVLIEDRAELASRVIADTKPGDVIVCMTVSGYENLADELAEKLAR
jgi:UDP-N-acetylmuramate--alanine ligase